MRKSSFLTFIFAFIPGAGQMYLGMMKKGVSVMLAFALITAISGFLNMPFFAIVLPVIWFYSFFDTFNIKAMTYEQRLQHEDKFLFNLENIVLKDDWKQILKKRHTLIGGGCIALGIYMLFQNLVNPYMHLIYDYAPWVYRIIHNIPTLIVSIAIIALGIHLVIGNNKKSTQPPQDDDFVEYGGHNHE